MMARPTWFLVCMTGLAIVLLSFYALFWRYVTPYDDRGLYPDGMVSAQEQVNFIEQQILPLLAESDAQPQKMILVFHWLDIDCQCTLLGKPFIEKLTTKGNAQLVRHIVLTKPEQQAQTQQWLALGESVTVVALSKESYQHSRRYIPSSPGASIYYRQTQSLSYFGPHSSGVTCGQGSNYIELVLNNLSHGFDPKLYELNSEGCFCSW